MRTSDFLFCLIVSIFFTSTAAYAQTVNFEETWKEFLENNKVSNTSELVKPDKRYDQQDYAKYLLIYTNSSLCQSEVGEAENLMAEIREFNTGVYKSIPGFVERMEEIVAKIEAYHAMDAIWNRFLQTKAVTLEELEAVEAAKTICEKRTLAKYSFMKAYGHSCRGDFSQAKDIFENRTLRLIEKTSFRVQEVEGLAAEVATMKSMFQNLAKLDIAWKRYIDTGDSPGFEIELPLFLCYPVPNMKAFVLKGAADVCRSGPEMLAQIKNLQAQTGLTPDGELGAKVKELEEAIEQNDRGLAVLNEAWEAFIPDNKVRHWGKYGYEYCNKEALIRAYIMDGFADVCGLAEEMLQEIDRVQSSEIIDLEEITMIKINELIALKEEHRINGEKIEMLWGQFVAQGDTLFEPYESAEFYCDNIHKVKDWTIQGLSASCEEGKPYLQKIEAFQETFEFNFTEEVECRIQNLRNKLWDCRYQIIRKIARLEASPDSYEKRLEELLEEYKMGPRPEPCALEK